MPLSQGDRRCAGGEVLPDAGVTVRRPGASGGATADAVVARSPYLPRQELFEAQLPATADDPGQRDFADLPNLDIARSRGAVELAPVSVQADRQLIYRRPPVEVKLAGCLVGQLVGALFKGLAPEFGASACG